MTEATARTIMTRDVITVTPDMPVKAFAQLLLKHGISGAPVLDATGRLTGIATEADIIIRDAAVHLPTVVTIFDSIIYLENPNKYAREFQKIIGGRVEDIMTQDVLTVGPETSLPELATLMHEKKRHLLPVMEAGRVIGIVGKADLVRAIAREE